MTETREQKAQRLVDDKRILVRSRSMLAVDASIEGDGGIHHTIYLKSGAFFCDCHWGLYHGNTREYCAHALALKMLTEKQEE